MITDLFIIKANKCFDDHQPVFWRLLRLLRAVLKHLAPHSSVLETGEATPPIHLHPMSSTFSTFSVSVCSE